MLLRVDPGSAVPLFEQLAASVRFDAVKGTIRPGERLPAAREVAASLDINVHTVLRAYQLLREEGLVDLRRGRGAVVTDHVAQYGELGDAVPLLVAQAKEVGLGVHALTAMIRQEYGS
ncbi:MAG: GntR family transcriptional regulator [Glaciihabitans sp.]|jgi:GntR family transcriptional regulator|nr:GntR family transcriptional regulator [Glaciihabitans sp.]